jgi:predicted permease
MLGILENLKILFIYLFIYLFIFIFIFIYLFIYLFFKTPAHWASRTHELWQVAIRAGGQNNNFLQI